MQTTYEGRQAQPRFAGPPPAMQERGQAPRKREQLRSAARQPSVQAREILHLGFTAAPLLAGADKFFDGMVDWERYLDPRAAELFGVSKRTFMKGVGVVEIAAGLLVAAKPRIGSYVVAGWLGGIIGNLLAQRDYYDIALRDFGLMLGAIALGRLESAK